MRRVVGIVAVFLTVALFVTTAVFAQDTSRPVIGNDAFQRLWDKQDRPIDQGLVTDRSWTWGFPVSGVKEERLNQGVDHKRTVQYFDKSRMEINDPNADDTSEWYITNGLLPIEMMTGKVQVGFDFETEFEKRNKANIVAIGDGSFPTYADLNQVYQNPGAMDPGTHRIGAPITALFNEDGSIGQLDTFIDDTNTIMVEVPEGNGYGVPSIFNDFMNQRGVVYENGRLVEQQIYSPLFVFGKPVSAPYWVQVSVGADEEGNLNAPIPVLFQVFERRVLTYIPSYDPPFNVQMGNVGQHYHQWRYGDTPAPQPDPDPDPEPDPEPYP